MKHYITMLIFSFSLLLSACDGDADFVGGEENVLQTEFYLQDNLNQETSNFLQGEILTLHLSLTNNGSKEITLEFPSSQQYDFYVKNSVDTEVWRWSANQLFAQGLTDIRIPAGNTVVFSENWNQRAFNGTLLPTGNYTVFAKVLGQEEQKYELNIQ